MQTNGGKREQMLRFYELIPALLTHAQVHVRALVFSQGLVWNHDRWGINFILKEGDQRFHATRDILHTAKFEDIDDLVQELWCSPYLFEM